MPRWDCHKLGMYVEMLPPPTPPVLSPADPITCVVMGSLSALASQTPGDGAE